MRPLSDSEMQRMKSVCVRSLDYRRIDVRPLSSAVGASVHGVDLSRPMDDETFAEVRRAFLEHLVIFFHDQHLTPDDLRRFALRFGPLYVDDYVKPMSGYPEVLEVIKEKDERYNFGGAWHYDVTYLERPALGSVLYAKEVPPFGGDTLFANMYLAYETLSEGMQAMIDGLSAVHHAAPAYGAEARARRFTKDRSIQLYDKDPAEAAREVEHPVVRTHPDTGRKALFVNEVYVSRFRGMTAEESGPLLSYLCAHAVRAEFTSRFRWQANDVAFWDNRCSQHYALNDYHGHRRVMQRVTVVGDRPS